MRLICPLCGERDLREFTCRGSAKLMARPAADAGAAMRRVAARGVLGTPLTPR